MAINKAMRLALKALSYPDLDVKKTYKLHRQFKNITHPYLKTEPYQICDYKFPGLEHDIPVRIFMPPADAEVPVKELQAMDVDLAENNKVMIFFHGGGWVVGNIDSYSTVCSNMAKQTGHIVVSVDYRLAPEYHFPAAVEDCYAVTRKIFLDTTLFGVKKEDITLIGDSAGGNLTAAVSLLARDRGEFLVSRQILIYPSTTSNHSETSPFPSVHENGTDYLLTSKRICEYMDLYKSCEEDLYSPYLAPLLADDLSRQPKTLIITAQYDPLRDEGEAYGKKLQEYGNDVTIYRMKDALHGFISLPKHFVHVKRSYELINRFLKDE